MFFFNFEHKDLFAVNEWEFFTGQLMVQNNTNESLPDWANVNRKRVWDKFCTAFPNLVHILDAHSEGINF